MGVLRRGEGPPVTLFAPGGIGERLEQRMRYADPVPGTKVGFAYGASGHADALGPIRREADRDAAEVRALAEEHRARQAIGFSRGARAVVGALAEDPALFERVVLVIPPGGRAAGTYSDWLASLPGCEWDGPTPEFLVVAQRGDRGHPVRVAELWAEQLAARLEILPAQALQTDRTGVAALVADFLSARDL